MVARSHDKKRASPPASPPSPPPPPPAFTLPSNWPLLLFYLIVAGALIQRIINRSLIRLKTSEDEVAGMRDAGRLAAELLDYIEPIAMRDASVTTEELDRLCHAYVVQRQHAVPAPLNYGGIFTSLFGISTEGTAGRQLCLYLNKGSQALRLGLDSVFGSGMWFGLPLCGFPRATCISVNEEVCHGIPATARILRRGDSLNIDVTVINSGGWHGDTSRTFVVGGIAAADAAARRLVTVAREALFVGIAMLEPGVRLGDVGAAIQRHCEAAGFSVVREYFGHGIGRGFHEGPVVAHYGEPGSGRPLEEGTIITIEPMVNAGTAAVEVLADQWTVITADGGRSAQWEHTVLVTRDSYEILTWGAKETWPHTVPRDRRGVEAMAQQQLRQEEEEEEEEAMPRRSTATSGGANDDDDDDPFD